MLNTGDQTPDVTLLEKNVPVPLSSFRGRWLVLFFYPKDNTAGCTAEVCSFRDAYEDFVEAGAEVAGVSSDDAASHERFRRSIVCRSGCLATQMKSRARRSEYPRRSGSFPAARCSSSTGRHDPACVQLAVRAVEARQ